MSFFVDANVIVYGALDSPYRDACLEILAAVAEGEADGKTSTAALEEVWYLESSGRVGAVNGLTRGAYALLAPLLPVGDDAFRLALELDVPSLGPNDRLHVATCDLAQIDVIVSADQGFDAVDGLRRVDPLDDEVLDVLRAA